MNRDGCQWLLYRPLAIIYWTQPPGVDFCCCDLLVADGGVYRGLSGEVR